MTAVAGIPVIPGSPIVADISEPEMSTDDNLIPDINSGVRTSVGPEISIRSTTVMEILVSVTGSHIPGSSRVISSALISLSANDALI